MSDVDEIKAGKYELVAVRWDKITSKPGDPLEFQRYRTGDVVELDVEEARRLVTAGAVVKPGAREQAQAAQALASLRAALEQLSPEQRQALLATGEAVEQPTAPKKRAAKKAAGKAADQPVTVTPAASTAPAPTGDSEPPQGDDGEDDGEDGDESLVAGSVDDVLGRVGTDGALAAQALTAELAKDKPRKSLVEQLEQLVESGDGGDGS